MAGESEKNIIVYGPIGSPGFLAGLPLGRDGYRVSLERIPVNTQAQQMASDADALFAKYKRPSPMRLIGDHLFIFPKTRYLKETASKTPHDKASFSIPGAIEVIDLNYLTQERLTKQEVWMIESSYLVEEFLPDFGDTVLGMNRGYNGLQEAGYQWIGEEQEHGNILEQILIRTKSRDPLQIEALRTETLQRKWINPYDTPRKTAIYAKFQEKITQLVYLALANNINRQREEQFRDEDGSERNKKLEPASVASRLLKLVGSDELVHNRFYTESTRLFADLDPKSTAEEVYFVASTFQMPADALLPDAARRFVHYRKGIGVNRVAFAAILYKSMLDFNTLKNPFIKESEARRVAAYYAGVEGVDGSNIVEFREKVLKQEKTILTIGGLAA